MDLDTRLALEEAAALSQQERERWASLDAEGPPAEVPAPAAGAAASSSRPPQGASSAADAVVAEEEEDSRHAATLACTAE
jgi:hypothetical protein